MTDFNEEELRKHLPECTFKRALDIAAERNERTGGVIIRDELAHLFPADMKSDDDDRLTLLLNEVFHAGAHVALDTFDSMVEKGMSPMQPLCYIMSVAFGEGMSLGAEAQRLYEQETRDELATIPTTEHR